MLLRQLVTNWMRQMAGERLRNAVSQATGKPNSDHDAVPPERFACHGVFVFALAVEAGGLVDRLQQTVIQRGAAVVQHLGYLDGQSVVVAQSGVGRQAAGDATRELLATYQPAWVISAGFASALRDTLRRGHILMADEVVDTAGEQLPIELNIERDGVERTGALHLGGLLTVDHLVRTAAERYELAKQYDALACDMETMAVARACREAGVRFLSVRVISDAIDDHWPREIERLLDHQSLAGKLGVATGAIFKRPSVVKDMWQLKEEALKGSDRLARFLAGVATQLPGE